MALRSLHGRALGLCAVLCVTASMATGVIGRAPDATGEPVRIVDVYMTQDQGPDGPWSIVPRVINVTAGETVQFRVYNNGTLIHDFYLDNPYNVSTGPILPGRTTTMEAITFGEATNGTVPVVSFWCEVPGHRQLGMMGDINILAPPAQNATAPAPAVPGSGAGVSQYPEVGAGPMLGWASIAAAFVFFAFIVMRRRPTH